MNFFNGVPTPKPPPVYKRCTAYIEQMDDGMWRCRCKPPRWECVNDRPAQRWREMLLTAEREVTRAGGNVLVVDAQRQVVAAYEWTALETDEESCHQEWGLVQVDHTEIRI